MSSESPVDFWTPEPIWAGERVYCIGGGPSLQTFDWDLLRSSHTIGCNVAFKLGSEVCDVCIFGDQKFRTHFRAELKVFDGLVVTNLPLLSRPRQRDVDMSWVKVMRRKPRGIGLGDTLAWNGNTGAAAVNLALLMGARIVYLLGYDMGMVEGRPNWHDEILIKPHADVYHRFAAGFDKLAVGVKQHFPDSTVINLTEGSQLETFPKESLIEHFHLAEAVCDGASD